jgi:hypothetical protein
MIDKSSIDFLENMQQGRVGGEQSPMTMRKEEYLKELTW